MWSSFIGVAHKGASTCITYGLDNESKITVREIGSRYVGNIHDIYTSGVLMMYRPSFYKEKTAVSAWRLVLYQLR